MEKIFGFNLDPVSKGSFMFDRWYKQHVLEIKDDYFRFLRFASVSGDSAFEKDVLNCAQFLMEYLRNGGLHSELIPTVGFPIVYAEDLSAGPKAKTILIYGHYDVQPVDPLELWESPPFEPTEREGKVFARGALDDKGQIFYACAAVLAWKKMGKTLPVNVKFCIEGEEESQSMGLEKALPSLKEKFAADVLLIVDFNSQPDGSPAVSLGARGCMALEVVLKGSTKDLHSGMMGGIAYNPNRAMAELLAKIWDEDGRVAVPGFYNDVSPVSKEEVNKFSLNVDKEELRRDFGLEAFSNEKGRSLGESNWLRPTLEINGLFGGYTGDGSKTVIPSHCTAKITCRLVPNQDPEKVFKAIVAFIQKNTVAGMQADVTYQGGMGAYRGSVDCPLVDAVAKASSEVTGKKCSPVLSGGSIPVAAEFVRVLGVQAVGMGYGLSTDDIHAPNEHFDMIRFEQGFLTVARILELL